MANGAALPNVVTNKELIEKLSQVTPYAGCAAGAPVVIVPAYYGKCSVPEYAQIDMSIAQENMWLETDALGLGGVWLGIAPIEERMKDVEKILGLPKELRAFSLFALGYPAQSRPQEDRFDTARIHYVR